MSTKSDGGPAFPLNPDTNFSHKGEIYKEASGMSMRDWFAGMAMQGLLSNSDGWQGMGGAEKRAYEIADDMLKERSK